ncbi:MAG: B12-binding domain-containing radical SAM protein [Arcobacter sp.]|nr:MAG: B12-binding domain-containing radical SAM protein [Arcobacter sp.]
MKIILSTLNARYTHSSIGLRYLYANMEELQKDTRLIEFSINEAIQTIAEKILDEEPNILGLGVYIWNATQTQELIEVIKKVSPKTKIVIGGPEVSYEPFRVDFSQVDFVLQGEGDTAFYKLCKEIITNTAPDEKIIKPVLADLGKIKLPYEHYTQHDIDNRYIYVEASRGCPFMCEFCLSSIDEKVRNFDIDILIKEFSHLWDLGVRNFKFIDRTFNLNMRFANAILDFFLSKEPPYFAHFEVIPDHFPESIKQKIALFPAGALQLEIGIQTLNTQVAENINRPLKLKKIYENLDFIENQTKAHVHLDLIVGLPGEDLESFGKNLNKLVSISSSEIQIGILKKLSGTTLDRHDLKFGMRYSDIPPYDILSNDLLSFKDIQKMKRFARFWDLTYNSGNFKKSISLLWKDETVYDSFFAFSEWIYTQTDSTWKISLDRLSKLLFQYLTEVLKQDALNVAEFLIQDLLKIKGRIIPSYLKPYAPMQLKKSNTEIMQANKRQAKHAV